MAGFLSWLPDVLRGAGVDVYVMPGAETRTSRSSGLSPLGVVWHHTATGPNWQDGHVAALLRDGRRDLAGPLAQVGIERDGTWVIVALGRANHNGYGHWGNDSIGLEFYNDGVGEPWPRAQVDSGIRGTRAILDYLGKRAGTAVLGHRETDPKRKVDPHGLDMSEVRRRIDSAVSAHQEDDMPLDAEDKKWLRALASEIAGNAERVDDWDHRYGQSGTRRSSVRWLGETVTLVRKLQADAIAKAVAKALSGAGTGSLTADDIEAAAKKGTEAAMREAFADDE